MSYTFDLYRGSPKECFPGLVNFVSAVACHICLNLPKHSHNLGSTLWQTLYTSFFLVLHRYENRGSQYTS